MATIGRGEPSWEGGVLRILRVISAFVKSIESDLTVVRHDPWRTWDLELPSELRAREVRRKAAEVEVELLRPLATPKGSLSIQEVLADESLPDDVKDQLGSLRDALEWQLSRWGYLSDADRKPSEKLIYQISEEDLSTLSRPLYRLQGTVGRYHQPRPLNMTPPGDEGWFWKAGFHEPSHVEWEPPRNVRFLNGRDGVFRPSTTKRWVLPPRWSEVAESIQVSAICLTEGRRWICGDSYADVDTSVRCFDPGSQTSFSQVSKRDAINWFVHNWLQSESEDRGQLPPELLPAIQKLDIDQDVRNRTRSGNQSLRQAEVGEDPKVGSSKVRGSKPDEEYEKDASESGNGVPSGETPSTTLAATDETLPIEGDARQVVPKNLDSQAVGHAYEMMAELKAINVSEVARRLGVERTSLYRCHGFMSLVRKDRASKRERPRGWKNKRDGSIEAYREDD